MPVTKLRDLQGSPYLELVFGFPLKPVRSARQLSQAHEVINSLLNKGKLSVDEADYLEVLARLVEAYEGEKHPTGAVSGAAMLKHLLEARGETQAGLAGATGIAESTVSALLAGKRSLGLAHIRKLAGYFKVDPSVFL